MTDLIEAGLVDPGDRLLHRGKPLHVAQQVLLVVQRHVVVVVVVVAGEAVRRAHRVGRALSGQARHRPQAVRHHGGVGLGQADHHGVCLLERSK